MRALLVALVVLPGCVYHVSPGYDGGAPDAVYLCPLECELAGNGCCGDLNSWGCVDHATNPIHCGACGVSCEDGESCVDGACVL
jgi:hypothetical protein